MNEPTKNMIVMLAFFAAFLMVLYLFGSVNWYSQDAVDDAKIDACQADFGPNSTWVAETDNDGVICTTDDGVGLTTYQEPEFRILDWIDYALVPGASP